MSACLCSFRALARSRTSNAKTLTPFLYQTATIQQRTSISHRNASNSSRSPSTDHDVPFEGEELPPAINDPAADRKTTITGSERAAFQKLYKKFNQAEQKGLNEDELDQIADEYYEDDDDNSKDKSGDSLDSLFDAVLSGKAAQKGPRPPDSAKKPVTLESLARNILESGPEDRKRKMKEEAAQKQARIKELRTSEKERVRKLLEAAPTDHELWAVLEAQVFSVIRSMDLDNSKASGSSGRKLKAQALAKTLSKSPSSKADPTRDPAVVYRTYSAHLYSAAQTLRTHFPASPLVFNIIPRVKELGRSSYALGASTNLYKTIIRAAFRQNHSYAQICSLLQDMDNGGIEYDYGVLKILDEVLSTHRQATKGQYGRAMQSIMKMDMYEDGLEKLRAWHTVVKKRVGDYGDDRKMNGSPPYRRVNHSREMNSREGGMGTRNNRRGANDGMQGGYRRTPPRVLDTLLEDSEIPFAEDVVPAKSAKQVPAQETIELESNVESFMRDTVDAPIESPVEPSIDVTVPPVDTPAQAPADTTEVTEAPASSGSKEDESKDGRAV